MWKGDREMSECKREMRLDDTAEMMSRFRLVSLLNKTKP